MRTLSLIIALGVILSYSGCKSDDDEGPSQQTLLQNIAKSWKVSSVTLDGTDNTAYYSDFSILISGTNPTSFNYSTSNRPHYSCWPSNGLLAFGTDPTKTIVRDKGGSDELIMTYTVTNTTLEVKFTFSGNPYNARTTSVAGQWVFVFGL